VAAEELLEVEDRELVALREGEELAERGVRVDRLLVHEVVGLGVGHDALGDLRAADLRVLGLAEEGAELIGDADGLREDAVLGRGTLDGGRLALATTALGLLGEACRELLDRLEVRGLLDGVGLGGRDELLLAGDGVRKRDGDVLIGRRNRGDLRRSNNGGRDDRGRNRGSGGGRLLAGLGRCRGGRGRNNGGDDGLSRLGGLRGLGGLGDGGRGGGAHYVGIGGSFG